jgi:hypothetical protein
MNQPRTILFVVIALGVMALSVYIVIVDMDLTALLVGLLIVFIIYALVRFVGRGSAAGMETERPVDSDVPVEGTPATPQVSAAPLPITINVNQAAAIPPPAQIMRRCAHCNTVYSENSARCPSCGAPF